LCTAILFFFISLPFRASLLAQVAVRTVLETEARTVAIWEGKIFDPQRPIIADIDFADRTATFSSTGSRSWPVVAEPTTGEAIRFAVQGSGWKFVFEGAVTDDVIKGEVAVSKQKLPFVLRRLPSLPKPQNRVEAWQQDIAILRTRFIQYDRSFSPEARAEFLRQLKTIDTHLPVSSDQQVMVALARGLALAHNGHTRLYLMRNRTEVSRIPLRIWWFNDELYIIRADGNTASLLGCNILKIGSHPVDEAFAKVEDIDAGSGTWKRYMSSYFLTSPDILFGAGLIPSSEAESLTISCKGVQREVSLPASPLERTNVPDEAWHDLAPGYNDQTQMCARLDRNLPLYLQKPTENYWFTYLPKDEVLYLQYNRAQASTNGPSPLQFEETVEQTIDQHHPRAIVFDLRFNTGGDGFMAEPLLKMIASKTPRLKVFEITGRSTFSAGIMAAAELREWAHATVVGEPAGDGLHFWAEGGNLVLPNSGLAAHYANGFDRRDHHLIRVLASSPETGERRQTVRPLSKERADRVFIAALVDGQRQRGHLRPDTRTHRPPTRRR
jgi:hypothetical protein